MADWNGYPLDEPGRDDRERRAYDELDAFVSRKHGFDFGDRLVVRYIRPSTQWPPSGVEESDDLRASNSLGVTRDEPSIGIEST